MFIWFCSAESFCCDSSFLEDMFATCFCRYVFVSVNFVKTYLSAADTCVKFATASLSFFSSATFSVKLCYWDGLDYISLWIIYSLLKRKRNLLKVFCIAGRLINFLYSN